MKSGIVKSIIIVGAISIFFACKREPLPNISSPTAQSVSSPTTPNNPSTTTAASLIITENNDSVFVADSAYWEYYMTGNAVLRAFAQGNRRLELHFGNPLVPNTYEIDGISGGPFYFIGQNEYSTAYAQRVVVNPVAGNLITGSFDHLMLGTLNHGLVNGVPTYSNIDNKRIKIVFENIPQKL
jgi:hypothetical protein